MKILNKLLLAIALATVAGSALAHNHTSEYNPLSVRAELGTMGFGGAVSYNVNPKVGVTLGYNGGDISSSGDMTFLGSDYDIRTKNNNVYLNAELRPFANPFYVAAGVAYIDAKYGLSQHAKDTNSVLRNIGGRNYESIDKDNLASVNGKVSYENTIAPYLGLGFSPATASRFGFFGEVGAYYAGSPEVEVDAKNLVLVGGDKTLAKQYTDNAKENLVTKYTDEAKFKWLPVAKLGVTYRF